MICSAGHANVRSLQQLSVNIVRTSYNAELEKFG